MPAMQGKRAFLELLRQEGVEVIFGNPGTTELPLMDALAVEDHPRYVLGLQEAVVMTMADGYAQASGKLAAVNLHVTPGLGNAMGMLYDAQKAGAPLLVTAGQHEQGFNVTEPILYADLPPIARPLVKWSAEVHRLADLPRMIHRAAKVALTPPTGPVFLSLPGDILNGEAEIELGSPVRVAPHFRADPAAVRAAAELLASARSPIIIAGDAVAQHGAHAEVAALAELLGAPVHLESVPSTASFPTSHPLFRGLSHRLPAPIRKLLDGHDVLLSLGGDLFTLSLPDSMEPIPPGCKVIHLDLDPWELGKNYATEIAMLGSPKTTVPDIVAALEAILSPAQKAAAGKRRDGVATAIARERAALHAQARAQADKSPVMPLALLQAIGEVLPKNAVVVEETLSSAPGLRELIASDDAKSFFGMRGGGIGWGMGAAIGVKLALPDRPVVALVGDGSAMYTIQALWTAAHDRVPVTWVIFNNRSYRILKQRTNALRGYSAQLDRFVAMDFLDPPIDFCGLARSMGVAAHTASTVAEAQAALKAAIASGVPTLIEVELDRAFKPV
ncbi:MAG: thiamine pyrophosphate-binding protein [Alphaproteobacteria bacterium]